SSVVDRSTLCFALRERNRHEELLSFCMMQRTPAGRNSSSRVHAVQRPRTAIIASRRIHVHITGSGGCVRLRATARATAICLVASLAPCLSSVVFARDKTDVLVMKNGDRITCEVKKLNAGVLYVDVDYVD